MELVVFSGIQAAGKSTFYQQRFATTHVRLDGTQELLRTATKSRVPDFAALLTAIHRPKAVPQSGGRGQSGGDGNS
jgi:predicted kinase